MIERLLFIAARKLKAKREFRVFKYGLNSSTKGNFLFNEGSAKVLMALYKKHGNRVSFDYDHRSIEPKTTEDGDAAGQCDLELRADGLWAVNCDWTDSAKKKIESGERTGFSPYFGATKDTGEIVELRNIAVTNDPALDSIEALAASRGTSVFVAAGPHQIPRDSHGRFGYGDGGDHPNPRGHHPAHEEDEQDRKEREERIKRNEETYASAKKKAEDATAKAKKTGNPVDHRAAAKAHREASKAAWDTGDSKAVDSHDAAAAAHDALQPMEGPGAKLSRSIDGVACTIVHGSDGKYRLYSKDGKKLLGTHGSKADAEKQEAAVNISKAREAGHNIPKPASHEGKDGAEGFLEKRQMAKKHALGGYMAKHLKEKGMALKELADKAGIHEDRMRALHDGEEPTPEEMKAVARGMGLKDGEIEESLEKMSAMDNDDIDDTEGDEEKAEKEKPAVKARRNSKGSRARGEESDAELDLVELTGTTDREKQRKMLKGVFAMAEAYQKDHEKLEVITAKAETQRREMLIEQGKKDGKLTPAMIRFWCKREIDEFEEFLKMAPVLSVQSLNLREGESTQAAAVLTREELEVCRLTDTSPDDMAEFVKNERNGKNLQLIRASYKA